MTRAAFYTTERLSERRSRTPEGFLIIHDVPIARTGEMDYHTSEVNIPGDSEGLVKILRDAEDVFTPEHIASYNGKPIVDEHPPEDVTPNNWRKYARGTVFNSRRGEGDLADLLVADFMITDGSAIDAVEGGKVEVSCGYDADYEELGVGKGRQKNLYGNHVALVDSGRCGPRCAIGDRKTVQRKSTGDCTMKKPARDKYYAAKAKLLTAVRNKDAEAEKEAEKEMKDAEGEMIEEAAAESNDTHVHIHRDGMAVAEPGVNSAEPQRMTDEEIRGGFSGINDTLEGLRSTMDAIAEHVGYKQEDATATEELEGQLEEEAPQGTGDKARKARDSVYLADSHQATVALAEILVPGITIPSFTRDAAPKKTLDAICHLRRTALDLAHKTTDGRAMIEAVHGTKPLTLDSMSCGAVRSLFNAVGALKKQKNKDASGRDAARTTDTNDGRPKGMPWTVDEIQKANDAHWAKVYGKQQPSA